MIRPDPARLRAAIARHADTIATLDLATVSTTYALARLGWWHEESDHSGVREVYDETGAYLGAWSAHGITRELRGGRCDCGCEAES